MSSIDDRIHYKSGEVILSIGYYSAKEIDNLFSTKPPEYLEAYEPRTDVFGQYMKLSRVYPAIHPVNKAVAGDERAVTLSGKRTGTTICMPLDENRPVLTTVALKDVITNVVNEHGRIDKLMMNCEGSEIDIILKTPSEYLEQCRTIIVSFHRFVDELKIGEKIYQQCLKKLSITHKGLLLHKTRYWWRFNRG